MKTKRRDFSPEQKLKIVKEGLQKDVKVSELCRLYEIYPTDFYHWKKQVSNSLNFTS